MSSSVHIYNKKKRYLNSCKGPTQGLDDNFADKFCLRLHYNGMNSVANDVRIYIFIANDSEINAALLYLGTVSKDFSADNIKSTGLNGYVYDFSVDEDTIDFTDILDIHKYSLKKHDIKCLNLFKKILIRLSSICTAGVLDRPSASSSKEPIKCISLNNQPSQGRPTLDDINYIALLSALINVVEVVMILMIHMLEYVF